MRNAIAMGLASTLLCACASAPVVVHEPVEVVRYVYVPIDKGLTAPCPVDDPLNRSVNEILRIARLRRSSLTGCANARLQAISRIQGSPLPAGVAPTVPPSVAKP